MYSNRQAFEDPFQHDPYIAENPLKTAASKMYNSVVVPIYSKNSIHYTNHLVLQSFKAFTPGWLFMVPLLAWIVHTWTTRGEIHLRGVTSTGIKLKDDKWGEATEQVLLEHQNEVKKEDEETFYDVMQKTHRETFIR
jgi:hypothetical protein